jgi:CDK inhibitor PHO81
MGIGVMLHVAYPECDRRDELCMGRCADVNSYVEAILKTVYQASASLGSTPHSRRRFAFMAHSPSVCTALNWKQPNCKPGVGQGGSSCFVSHRDRRQMESSSRPMAE